MGIVAWVFVANFIRFPAMQNVWNSVKIWQSCREFRWELFWDTVYILQT